MIPYQIMDKVFANEKHTKEVIRLAYEIAYEASLKEPEEGSIEFTVERMQALRQIFESSE